MPDIIFCEKCGFITAECVCDSIPSQEEINQIVDSIESNYCLSEEERETVLEESWLDTVERFDDLMRAFAEFEEEEGEIK